MKAHGTKRSLAAAVLALGAFGAAAPVPAGASEGRNADVAVTTATDTTAVIHLSDGTGKQRFFSVVRDDEDAPWRIEDGLAAKRGIVFGNRQPRLPSIAILRDNGVHPPDVVKPFSLAIAEEQFDDLSVYRVSDDEFAIVLINDGLVSSIHYAGRFLEIVLEARLESLPHCDAFKLHCCRTMKMGDPAGGEENKVDVPMPHLPSCLMAMTACPNVMRDTCGCLAEACNCSWNTDHPAHEHCVGNPHKMNACIDHRDFCDGNGLPKNDDDDQVDNGDESDQNPRQLIELLEKVVDLLATD